MKFRTPTPQPTPKQAAPPAAQPKPARVRIAPPSKGTYVPTEAAKSKTDKAPSPVKGSVVIRSKAPALTGGSAGWGARLLAECEAIWPALGQYKSHGDPTFAKLLGGQDDPDDRTNYSNWTQYKPDDDGNWDGSPPQSSNDMVYAHLLLMAGAPKTLIGLDPPEGSGWTVDANKRLLKRAGRLDAWGAGTFRYTRGDLVLYRRFTGNAIRVKAAVVDQSTTSSVTLFGAGVPVDAQGTEGIARIVEDLEHLANATLAVIRGG